MARRAKTAWRLITRPGTQVLQVDFRHAGKRHRESTGSADLATAEVEAARIYSEVISGRRDKKAQRKVGRSGGALDVLFAEWLASLDGLLDTRTTDSYEMYVRAHYLPFFRTLDRLTTASCSDYQRARLRKVQATTLRKELSGLRGFIAWAVEQSHLLAEDAPVVRSVPKKATGTPDDVRRKVGGWVDLTPEEAAAILDQLPVTGRRNRPLRAYYTVLWETSLRPETLVSLRAPGDYKRGSAVLKIRDEADKARFGRELPLTDAAREALDSVCPDTGSLFPRRKNGKAADYRVSLRAAAKAAGLEADRASRISDYDFRHGRITNWVEETGDILGTGYLAGHKHATTTSIYAHARKSMAEKVLGQVSKKGRRL